MASYDATDLLKICYNEEDIETTLAKRTGIWNRAKKYTEGKPSAGGQYFEFYAETVRAQGGGWVDTNGATRTPTNPDGVLGKVYPKFFHHALQIDAFAMALSETDMQAYDRALNRYRNSMMDNIVRRRCHAIYGNSLGVQARIGDTATSTTHTVKGMYNFTDGAGNYVIWGAEMFEQGDQVCIINSGTGALIQATTVVSFTPSNPVTNTSGTVTFADSFTGVNNAYIVFGESLAKSDYSAAGRAPTGFADLFGTGLYENITSTDPAGNYAPKWKTPIYTGATAGTPESMDSSHLFKVIRGPSTVSDRKINMVGMNDALMQSFIQYFEQQVRFTDTDFQGGMREVKWTLPEQGDVTIYFDSIFPHGCIIGLAEDKLRRFETKKAGWENKSGSEFHLVQGSIAYYSLWTEAWTLGTMARAAHSIHKDIREELTLWT